MKNIATIILTLTSLVSFSFSPSINYIKYIESNGVESVDDMTIDNEGNMILIGTFSGTVDFNSTEKINELTSSDKSVFILKLDQHCNFIWVKHFDGGSYFRLNGVVVDRFGKITIQGSFAGAVDFDPSDKEQIKLGGSDIFLVQLSSKGNLNWFHQMNDGLGTNGYGITIDSYGNIITIGRNLSSMDLDPGANLFEVPGSGGPAVYVRKLTPDGKFINGQSIQAHNGTAYGYDIAVNSKNEIVAYGNASSDIVVNSLDNRDTIRFTSILSGFMVHFNSDLEYKKTDLILGNLSHVDGNITFDKNDNLIVSGSYEDTVDFDLGIGESYLESNGKELFIVKYDNTGAFQWVKNVNGSFTETATGLATDKENNIFLTANFSNQISYEKDGNTEVLNSFGDKDYVFLAYNSEGKLNYTTNLGSTADDESSTLILDQNENLFIAGLGEESGTKGAFIRKFDHKLCSGLSSNIDSIKNVTCSDDGFISVSGKEGKPPYNYEWINQGEFDAILEPHQTGVYTAKITDQNGCIVQENIYLKGTYLKGDKFDAYSSLIINEFRTGFTGHMWLHSSFNACFPTSGQVELILDNKIEYKGASPSPNYISENNDTLVWDIEDLIYPDFIEKFRIDYRTKLDASFGDTVCIKVKTSSEIKEEFTANNERNFCFEVVNGYDPNDKQVYPKGQCEENYTLMTDDTLTYKIRCQNTGNSHAVNIIIEDSISEYLDINTFRVLSYSHPMELEITPENIVKFKFDSILLPDSASNEPESHGFVVFQISPKKDIIPGTVIKNKAEIYFDYNPAIITNLTRNTYVNEINSCFPNGIEKVEAINVVYPNPFNSLINIERDYDEAFIYDISGKLCGSFDGSRKVLNLTSYQSGVYFLKFKQGENTSTLKIVKK